MITLSAILLFACKSKPEKTVENTVNNLVYERVWDRSTHTYGYQDNLGNMVIPFGIYSFLQEDEKGMILAKKSDKEGYIDIHQNILVPFEYNKIRIFCEDLAFAQKNDQGKYGVIDRQGNIVIPFLYDERSHFYPNGLAAVTKNGRHGFIDKQGNEIIPIQYDDVSYTTFDRTVLAKSKNKWAFFSNDGKQLTPFQFDKIIESVHHTSPEQNPNFKTKQYPGISSSLFSNGRVLVKQNIYSEPLYLGTTRMPNPSIKAQKPSLSIKASSGLLTPQKTLFSLHHILKLNIPNHTRQNTLPLTIIFLLQEKTSLSAYGIIAWNPYQTMNTKLTSFITYHLRIQPSICLSLKIRQTKRE